MKAYDQIVEENLTDANAQQSKEHLSCDFETLHLKTMLIQIKKNCITHPKTEKKMTYYLISSCTIQIWL